MGSFVWHSHISGCSPCHLTLTANYYFYTCRKRQHRVTSVLPFSKRLEFQFRNKIDWARFRNRSIRFEAKIHCGFHEGHNLCSSGSKSAACLTHPITQPSPAVDFLIHQCTLVFAIALKMAHGKKQNGF